MARRRDVVPGQRYLATDSNAVWEVSDINADAAGIQHARMVRADDPTSIKVIAVSVLRDGRRFRPMGEEP